MFARYANLPTSQAYTNHPSVWHFLCLHSRHNIAPHSKLTTIKIPFETIQNSWKNYNPQVLAWNLKMMVSNRNLLFQGLIFRFHVKLWGVVRLGMSFIKFLWHSKYCNFWRGCLVWCLLPAIYLDPFRPGTKLQNFFGIFAGQNLLFWRGFCLKGKIKKRQCKKESYWIRICMVATTGTSHERKSIRNPMVLSGITDWFFRK